ncbi:MAG: hypothetical protein M1827_005178 [Pycnora praestabilis]|nr:MAG: hypothetical protein M1827_005178 [Pycnora praestabilis]
MAPSEAESPTAMELVLMGVELKSKYEQTSDLHHLVTAIQKGHRAVDVSNSDRDKAVCLNNLGNWLALRFEKTGSLEDLQQAVQCGRQTISIMPSNTGNRAIYFSSLSNTLGNRYRRLGSVEDLHEAITLSRNALDATIMGDDDRAFLLNSLASRLGSRYDHTGEVEALEEAISKNRQAIKEASSNDVYLGMYSNNLSLDLRARYKRFGLPRDIEDAIVCARKAVEVTPPHHMHHARYSNNLCAALFSKYDNTGSLKALDDSIELGRHTLQITPPGYLEKIDILVNLANSVKSRGIYARSSADLDEAIIMTREALGQLPKDYPKRPLILANLSNHLSAKYALDGNLQDLDEALHKAQEAVDTTLDNDTIGRMQRLVTVSNRLRERYERLGTLKDLQDAIASGRLLNSITPADHGDRPSWMHNLAIMLSDRYIRMGSVEDLEEAIELERMAVQIREEAYGERNLDSDRAMSLNGLSNDLKYRYERTKALGDLHEAIQHATKAVAAVSRDHPSRPVYLNTLSNRLESRYERMHNVDDLVASIFAAREALSGFSKDHPDRGMYLSNLGNRLAARCKIPGLTPEEAQSNFDECLALAQEAVDTTSTNDPQRLIYLHNLGSRYMTRFEALARTDDLDQAIDKARACADAAPAAHPDRSDYLRTLAIRTVQRAKRDVKISDLDEALVHFEDAFAITNALPLPRIEAGRFAAYLMMQKSRWTDASKMLERVVGLFPTVSSRSSVRDDQQYVLRGLSGIAAFAASAALNAGKEVSQALITLEAGRAIMTGLAIDFRSDISALGDIDPTLCSEYQILRDRVSTTIPDTSSSNQSTKSTPMHDAVLERQKDVAELEALETRIRSLPGFERFLLAPTATDLMRQAEYGPIVCFNVTAFRSDALLVTKASVRELPLPQLSHSELTESMLKLAGKQKLSNSRLTEKAANNRDLRRILRWLYWVAVQPVLEALDLLSIKEATVLPRIWWVTNGLMGLAPLHAAGDGWGTTTNNTLSHVVSSYIPTFKALAYARERSMRRRTQSKDQLLVVSMPQTIGMNDLNVTEEVVAIQRAFTGGSLPKILRSASKSEVLEELPKSSIVHFACHGGSDPDDPSNSALFLRGDSSTPARLEIRELATIRHENAKIAYLSACSTAENSATQLMDEVIHIASVFQLVGFPHVIGTLWEANDKAAVKVAAGFYDRLAAKQEYDSGDIAYALHDAVKALREQKLRRGTMSDDVISWAPFVHIGA